MNEKTKCNRVDEVADELTDHLVQDLDSGSPNLREHAYDRDEQVGRANAIDNFFVPLWDALKRRIEIGNELNHKR